MAKKEELGYLQLPVPPAQKESTVARWDWGGLNKRLPLDTGELSHMKNISTQHPPYLTPSQVRAKTQHVFSGVPVGLYAFYDYMVALHWQGGNITVRHMSGNQVATGTFPASPAHDGNVMRCVVLFNVWDLEKFDHDPLNGEYTQKLVIFPDGWTMDAMPSGGLNLAQIAYAMPTIYYATVYLSRIYGVGAGEGSPRPGKPDRIYVSAFNDYSNWLPDTADRFNASGAWVSAAQSNVRAIGDFTGVATYLNSVVTFKRDYMHEVLGTQKPFRIADIYAEGAIDHRTIQDVDGKLIFVSEDAVKVYTGGDPRIISHNLGVGRFAYAVAGTDGTRYYLYCEDGEAHRHLFVYDTYTLRWAEEHINERAYMFANNNIGLWMLTDTGLYRLDTGDYAGQQWEAETDLVSGRTINIKRVQKIQMLADVAPGSTITAEMHYDNGAKAEHVFQHTNTTGQEQTVAIRVVPRRTAHWGHKLKLLGTGFSRVYQAEITLKAGGGLYA